ncbi:hypothetical protein K0U91_06180 [Chryseobacterium chendengshani]|uniref:hypothetical protein n=1 Tax=Chryseobacterium sp. LJ668 TaxID=2864040 RepID=UPI001C692D26|nr:hypothetical protein [Chryseobacterium sp. LJ668]MBW8522058.1 hypothetical protein [Chryseobacterium sp. LJ668]QYK17710.1 hypothetical protein K0U91_06180 [Chryseobacterium sp. LJ668]
MIKNYLILFVLTMIISCKTDEKKSYDKFIVDQNIINNDTIKLLSKYPELKLFEDEIFESKTRTAYIIETTNLFKIDNYKCETFYKNDTLNILLNNSNEYFGNGILIKVFDGEFFIKDIDPKTLHRERKFIKTSLVYQKLILNKNNFQKNDSIYGFIHYNTKVESFTKDFRGYFKAVIK